AENADFLAAAEDHMVGEYGSRNEHRGHPLNVWSRDCTPAVSSAGRNKCFLIYMAIRKGYMYLIGFFLPCQWFTVTLSAFFLAVFSLQNLIFAV
ncbi:MAG: hypothetical protein J6K73_15620, partial [Clostridia bacterium]|nr:hypothetical protein [Clostridia bacterium]